VDVPDGAVLEQGGRDEQPVIGRFLDKRDDRGNTPGRRGELREARIVEADGHLRGEVLEQVPGQPELREHDQPGTLLASVREQPVVGGEVLVEQPQARGDLGERDPERLHGPSIAGRRRAPGGVRRRPRCRPE
jgi:hypothetical protein